MSTPSGNPLSMTFWISSLKTFWLDEKSISIWPSSNLILSSGVCWLTAIAGIPREAASVAAPIVPEVDSSPLPVFLPVFIPEITKSGQSSIIS